MDICISTVDRTKADDGSVRIGARNYLQHTLDSLYDSAWTGRVTLYFNSDSTGYAATGRPALSTRTLDDGELRRVRSRNTHYRAAYNYWKILSGGQGPVLILEDDVELSRNWHALLLHTLEEIERSCDRYLLTLYSAYVESEEAPGYCWEFPVEGFYGTQAIYCPASVRPMLTDYLFEHAVSRFRDPYDLLVKAFCIESGIRLFGCRRSLAQHAAPDDSTGLGGGHQSPTFGPRTDHPPISETYVAESGEIVPSESEGGFAIKLHANARTVPCNAAAAWVWSHCDGRRTLGELAEELAEAFPEQTGQVASDVVRAARALATARLIRRSGEKTSLRLPPTASIFDRYCIAKMNGGLGNQLFQIAAMLSHAQRHDAMPLVQHWDHARWFRGELVCADRLPADAVVYGDPSFHYREIPDHPRLVLDGFFQSPRYFDEAVVRRFLSPARGVLDAVAARHQGLLRLEPVSLHVRRGDYLSMPKLHPVLPMRYYERAMSEFGPDSVFAVFSDDIDWCKRHFSIPNVVFVEGQQAHEDLFLMSLCRGHIIANSSFSWWGAWLNERPDKKVLAPSTWFGPGYARYDTRDLLPDSWQRVAY